MPDNEDLSQRLERIDAKLNDTSNDTVSKWERRIEKHGWPAFFLVVILLAGWRVCDWAAPLLQETVKAHWNYLKSNQETQEAQVENGKVLANQTTKLTEICERQEKRSEEISRKLNDVHSVVVKPPGKSEP